MHIPKDRPRRPAVRLAWLAVAVALVLVVAWRFTMPPTDRADGSADTAEAGPPWRYGATDARFTITLYADLECPYCGAYFPRLRAWVNLHPDVRLQWHHLPLPDHEPQASALASAAECAGAIEGQAGYWATVDWIYRHTRGGGQGLPEGTALPGQRAELAACLESGRPQAIVREQAGEALHDGISATPALRLHDSISGQTLLLPGPVEGDALLSALDLLSVSAASTPLLAPTATTWSP
ncbi:DsbA family protein [Pseudomonas sp. B392_1p]|uniref:DsbA family protein n=1 Tax=Pseudomonas sp. B392_1p TaxID=3457507 RepID=UPI003FD2F784